MITTKLSTILDELVATYGTVREKEFKEKEAEFKARIFKIFLSPAHICKEVRELCKLGKAAQRSYTKNQTLALGLKLIQNMEEI